MEVRFAFFIMVHQKPYQFEWLLNAIYNEDDIFLIHVDLKTVLPLKRERRGVYAEVRRLIADKPNVRLMRPRFTNWGGWSLSKTMLDAIDNLLAADVRWTHFVNLSGQCYPLKSLSAIRAKVAGAADREAVEMRSFSSLPSDDWHLRRALMIETPVRAFALPRARPDPRSFELAYKGSQWVMLTRPFCEWIRASPMRRRIVRHLRWSHLTDELIVQTLLRNSPFRGAVADHYGRAIVWPGPRVLRAEDQPLLAAETSLFGRKFDAAVDAAVLRGLAEDCGFTPGPVPASAT